MKKFIINFRLPLIILFIWMLTISLAGFWSIRNLPFTPTFPYYHDLSDHYNRSVASFAHFDGIHYLRLINHGYDDTGSQAFFPVYPMLIRLASFGMLDPLHVAIALNTICLLISLYLISLQLSKNQLVRFILLFLSFPVSFYMLANYTESFFVLLVVLFFHCTRMSKYFPAAIVAGVASGTRLVGIFLVVALLIELIQKKQRLVYSAGILAIAVSGLLGYMYFLLVKFGDPLMFIHVQSMFNTGRSNGEIILLPQVIYRYLKILTTVTPTSILYIRAFWEFLTFTVSLIALYLYRKKMDLSALIFCLCAIVLPTLSGTFSSFPRYLLVTIPLFISLAINLPSRVYWVTVITQYGILVAAVALYVQGIFIV